MALKYYSDEGLTNELTTLTTQHSAEGESREIQIFIANDSTDFRYEDIVITPEDTDTSTDERGWIELALDDGGVPGAYRNPGESLEFTNISDQEAHPFWVKITTPEVGRAQNKTDLRLNTTFKEFAV